MVDKSEKTTEDIGRREGLDGGGLRAKAVRRPRNSSGAGSPAAKLAIVHQRLECCFDLIEELARLQDDAELLLHVKSVRKEWT